MYPKRPASAKYSDVKETKSRKYLNTDQKEELRKVIAERLSKKFGLKYQDLIKTEVNNFMYENKNITGDALKQLEDNIKVVTHNNKQNARGLEDGQDDKSVKSGISKMSGGSNFDEFDKFSKLKTVQKDTIQDDHLKNKKLQTLNLKRPENDLEFLEEENEWAAINTYNKFLFEKEQQLLKDKMKGQKEKLKYELDRQVEEKQYKTIQEKTEKGKYVENMQLQMKMHDEKEDQKKQTLQQLRQAEKDARLRQIKENKYRKRHEDKQEKALDQYLMQKVREEINAEQKYLEFKKHHQKEIMEKLKEENEKRRKNVEQQEREEKEDNVKLMQAYAKLIEEQEKERERTMQERDKKMKEFQLKALQVVKQENEDKYNFMDKRRDKYERRHELKLQREEEQKKEKEQQQKSEIKEYLFKQMDEKSKRQSDFKKEFNQQADIWKQDGDKFQEFETNKNNSKKQILKEYSNTLKQQISEVERSKKLSQQKMNENEALLNKQLLEELDALQLSQN